jgi:hypothetical protein
MRSFFLKALFFIIGISLLLNLLGTLADRKAPLEDWRLYYEQNLANLTARNDVIEAITLGSSHADSIDYSALGIEGQSLALAAADLFEIEKTVSSLDNKLPRLNTVIITISDYTFNWDTSADQRLRPRRIGFYSEIPVWPPISGDGFNFLMGRLDAYTHVLRVVRSDNWKDVWPELLLRTPAADPFPYDGVRTTSAWGECSHYTEEQLIDHAFRIASNNVSTSQQMTAAHPGLEQDSYAALARTIEHLQSRGIRVILYTPAYYDQYTADFSEAGSSIIDQMKHAVARLQETYGVEYYDFSTDPEITTHPELFSNSDHVNACGSRVVSEKLRERMNENSTLQK